MAEGTTTRPAVALSLVPGGSVASEVAARAVASPRSLQARARLDDAIPGGNIRILCTFCAAGAQLKQDGSDETKACFVGRDTSYFELMHYLIEEKNFPPSSLRYAGLPDAAGQPTLIAIQSADDLEAAFESYEGGGENYLRLFLSEIQYEGVFVPDAADGEPDFMDASASSVEPEAELPRSASSEQTEAEMEECMDAIDRLESARLESVVRSASAEQLHRLVAAKALSPKAASAEGRQVVVGQDRVAAAVENALRRSA
jgi:hypothetical protein